MSTPPLTLKWEPLPVKGIPSEVVHEVRSLSRMAMCEEISKLPDGAWVTITDSAGEKIYNYFAKDFDPRIL